MYTVGRELDRNSELKGLRRDDNKKKERIAYGNATKYRKCIFTGMNVKAKLGLRISERGSLGGVRKRESEDRKEGVNTDAKKQRRNEEEWARVAPVQYTHTSS